ncbi:calcium/proton exchanger [Acephala macrosclerotiorum]|nr:calcium/proton exchanger [Acephala macrosclerotiorum]
MMNANGSRPADEDETVPLLAPDDSEPSRPPNNSSMRPVWFQGLLCVYHAARRTARQLININVLWVFAPLGLTSGALHWNSISTSIFNFLAIIPLSAAVSNASDKLSDAFGDLLGALINATFGNAVELIVGILAVVHGDTALAQSIMLGSILSDILFVLGSCFFSAAWRAPILELNKTVSGSLSSLMIITAVALVLPTALYSTFESSKPDDIDKQILGFSRGTAVVLLVLYIAYLYFELVSHKELFEGGPDESAAHNDGDDSGVPTTPITRRGTWLDTRRDRERGGSDSGVSTPVTRRGTGLDTRQDREQDTQQDTEQDAQQDTPSINSLLTTSAALICSAAGIMFCSHFLLDSINATSEATHISRTFIATILIPIASNAPECATVVGTAQSGRIDFAVGVIVGSILQIALFVIPALVILGWVVHQPMTLNFETFQTIILFLAILLVNHLLQNGRYTYMHGLLLVALYAIIAIAFFLRDDI